MDQSHTTQDEEKGKGYGGQSHQEGPDPALMAQVRSNPEVERELLVKSIQIAVPQIMGGDSNWLYIMAPQEDDLLYLLDVCGATLEEGELLTPRENGILLSRQVSCSGMMLSCWIS